MGNGINYVAFLHCWEGDENENKLPLFPYKTGNTMRVHIIERNVRERVKWNWRKKANVIKHFLLLREKKFHQNNKTQAKQKLIIIYFRTLRRHEYIKNQNSSDGEEIFSRKYLKTWKMHTVLIYWNFTSFYRHFTRRRVIKYHNREMLRHFELPKQLKFIFGWNRGNIFLFLLSSKHYQPANVLPLLIMFFFILSKVKKNCNW